MIGDLLDAPTPVPADNSTVTSHPSEVDLFADADFVSAKPQSKAGINVDLFASQPSSSPVASSTMDFFAAPDPVVQPDVRSSKPVQTNTTTVDPFAAVPLNNFDSSDPFGAFVSPADPTSVPNASATSGGNQQSPNKLHNLEAKPTPKKDNFQVSSGIWADSLSRGLIDLNIAAPTKVNLADVGIVGGLTDGSDVKEKGPTTFYMGRAMGQGTKLGQSGFTSTATSADDFFSSHQNYQFGSFQK